MSKECMLTTFDNPFDYFNDFTSWLLYDKENHYNTCEFLARFVVLEEGMTQKEENEAVERAIDYIIENDITGRYIKVTRTE